MTTDGTLHHMRKTQAIYLNFFEPKNFKLSVYNLYSLIFNGKQFLFFVERDKIWRKKLNKFSYGKITWKKVR